MAEVFLGRLVGRDGFSRAVAIKRVLAHLATDDAFAKMFVAEAQICAKLQHPNIVSVLDFDRDGCAREFEPPASETRCVWRPRRREHRLNAPTNRLGVWPWRGFDERGLRAER